MKITILLINVIKSKITPLWTKIKLWTNSGHLWNKAGIFLRDKFLKALNIRPRHAHDYYGVGRWLVSKRLAAALMLTAGVLSICYIGMMKPEHLLGEEQGYRAYRYNSIPLKFHKGQVKILGKSGYTAYIGAVKDGQAQGNGTLYSKEGNVIYQGKFAGNQYQGEGTLNYPGSLLQYEGGFQKNLFQGTGILYRETGTKEYEGEFFQGKKQGKGMLYEDTGNLVYTGSFQADEVAYEELIGKTTKEAAEMYTGNRKVYSMGSEVCVTMPKIQAVYHGETQEDTLEEEWKITSVYVLKDTFRAGDRQLSAISELTEYFGNPDYEGHTEAVFSDAVALNQLPSLEKNFGIAVEMNGSSAFADVENIENFDDTYPLYVTVYTDEKCQYLFFSDKKRTEFYFYMIGKLKEE